MAAAMAVTSIAASAASIATIPAVVSSVSVVATLVSIIRVAIRVTEAVGVWTPSIVGPVLTSVIAPVVTVVARLPGANHYMHARVCRPGAAETDNEYGRQ